MILGRTHKKPRLPATLFFCKVQKYCSLQSECKSEINHLFNLPLSAEAFQQLLVLAQDLDDVSQVHDQDDIWTYIWGSPLYVPMKAYNHLIGSKQVHACYNWLWKSSVQKKDKVFFWLLLRNRLSTRNILRRKNRSFHLMTVCFVQLEGTLEHLFLNCPFAISCWNLLNLTVPSGEPFDILLSFKVQLNLEFFMAIIIIMAWSIWMARNDFIFRGTYTTENSSCKRKI
jgi:hypothetical protein